MRIVSHEIRACRHSAGLPSSGALRGSEGGQTALEFTVTTLKTESGREASMFGFAGRSALGAAHLAAASLGPFVLGRNALDREALWHDWQKADRWWHHLPRYSYGPLDCCLWLLGAEAAEQPLWRYLGGAREEVPVYASSLVLKDADAYVAEALAVQAAGLKAYKIHPPAKSLEEDLDVYKAVRFAVGSGFPLMADPVQAHTFDEALRLGRALENLGYLWLEEPLADEAFGALRELTRKLDIPIVGTEILAKPPYSIAECIATRVVDAVRADVSWSGGVTGVMKTARLAEAFHMNCEVHTSIFHPLDLVNIHITGAIRNCGFVEILWPSTTFDFGLTSGLPIRQGIAQMPTAPGLGQALDWDMIDNATLEIM